jgi:hypothetical protein
MGQRVINAKKQNNMPDSLSYSKTTAQAIRATAHNEKIADNISASRNKKFKFDGQNLILTKLQY